jgi:hypothetical protein
MRGLELSELACGFVFVGRQEGAHAFLNFLIQLLGPVFVDLLSGDSEFEERFFDRWEDDAQEPDEKNGRECRIRVASGAFKDLALVTIEVRDVERPCDPFRGTAADRDVAKPSLERLDDLADSVRIMDRNERRRLGFAFRLDEVERLFIVRLSRRLRGFVYEILERRARIPAKRRRICSSTIPFP